MRDDQGGLVASPQRLGHAVAVALARLALEAREGHPLARVEPREDLPQRRALLREPLALVLFHGRTVGASLLRVKKDLRRVGRFTTADERVAFVRRGVDREADPSRAWLLPAKPRGE